MKKLKRKETMENNPSSKQQDEGDDDKNDLLSRIPLNLKVEILSKLPAKSVAKLSFLSKFWLSTIRSRDFTKLFLARSSTQPRLLSIVPRRPGNINRKRSQFFHSSSQDDAFSDHHITPSELWSDNSPPVRGLLCCEYLYRVVISNPTTGQFVTLPRVKTIRTGILSFFGYEPINDAYKVLFMTVKGVDKKRGSKVVADEFQVFTLGGAQNSGWRMIECKIPHLPTSITNVMCKNGFVYYHAWINMDGCLISFDLRTEEFDLIKLPEDIRLLDYCNLVNYNGKIGLTRASFYGTLDLRVLEDVSKQEWSKVSLSIPSWGDLVGNDEFMFRGVLGNGELVFSLRSFHKSFYMVCYDPKENKARRVVIEGIESDFYTQVFMDHVENPMFLSVNLINLFFSVKSRVRSLMVVVVSSFLINDIVWLWIMQMECL